MAQEQSPVRTEVAVEKQQRVGELNSILSRNNLAPLYRVEDLGDASRGEIEVREIGDVDSLGDGLHLVEIRTLNPDGNAGRFVTFFRDRESLARQNLLVPFVTGAPGNFDLPDDVSPPDETVGRINQQLAQFNLRRLPTIVNSTNETIVDIDRVNDKNNRFFTVVTFKVKDAEGQIKDRPMAFNANSANNIDGAVFAFIARLPEFGMEPRIMIGQQYRQALGGWVTETFRGFYSPRRGGQGPEIRTNIINVPAMKRALDEIMDETGLREADSMKRLGRFKQDPATDFVYPDIWLAEASMPEFGEQDLEASERIRMDSMSYGEYFKDMDRLADPFTISALTAAFIEKRMLRLNKRGRDTEEKMALASEFRFQYGRHLTETFRGTPDMVPLDRDLGQVAFNSGVARIIPRIYSGTIPWEEFKRGVGEQGLKKVRVLHPFEVFEEIERGKIDDILTITAVIKALHSKGYLELANLR